MLEKPLLGLQLAAMARRDTWPAARLATYQAKRLAQLRRFAMARSPFYARFHKGLADAPLGALPVLTKAQMMEAFDDLVTDRTLRLSEIEAFAATMDRTARFRGRYQIVATSGTTGKRALLVYGPREWRWVMASAPRISRWSGADMRRAGNGVMISTHVPWHMTVRASADAGRLGLSAVAAAIDSVEPLDAVVTHLNARNPAVLNGYTSMIQLLAAEKKAGRLRIAPKHIFCTSETMTVTARDEIMSAFGIRPDNIYAVSEAGCIGGTCTYGGLHIAGDLCLLEIVDEANKPVPAGERGAKTLLTVLYGRTMPLIRYEIGDCLTVASEPCRCGRATLLLKQIEGRASEMLHLPARNGGTVTIAPAQIASAFRGLSVPGWQVLAAPGRMTLRIVDRNGRSMAAKIEARLQEKLAALGAIPPVIEVAFCPELPRGASGKISPIIATPSPGTVCADQTGR